MPVIEIKHLSKNYGKQIGIRDVSFSVNEGEIFGFVGPNGAGKSTTIKTLLGFIFATGGSAFISGFDVQKDIRTIKSFTGYVPSDVRLYSNMKVKELLCRNADFYPGDHKEETERLCTLFEIDVNKSFHELSTGNKQKVSIVCALMPKPKLVILDEPTNGLDPMMQKKLFKELKSQTEHGVTVLMSSHNLAEVQEYCTRVAFIKNGTILTVTDISISDKPIKILTIIGGGEEIPTGMELLSQDGRNRVLRTSLSGMDLLNALTQIGPDDFTTANESMEERFWSLYGREDIK